MLLSIFVVALSCGFFGTGAALGEPDEMDDDPRASREIQDTEELVPFLCVNKWIFLMNRFDGSVDFNRNWADYKNGFGDTQTTEFWIGNENIHWYTNRPSASYTLRVEFQARNSGKWYYAEYERFKVDSEWNKYAIHLSGYTGNGGDSLTNTTVASKWNQNGMRFSTPDADNDRGTSNCAVTYSTGWWFNNCWWSCLTCNYNSENFSWYTLHDLGLQDKGRLRVVRMMIVSY